MAYRHANYPCQLSRDERMKICAKCVDWADEEDAEYTNDTTHCVNDKFGLVTSHFEETGECNYFFER